MKPPRESPGHGRVESPVSVTSRKTLAPQKMLLGGCGLQKEVIFNSLNVHLPCLHLKILGAAILSGNESLEYVFAKPKSGKCPLVPEIGERTQALGLGSKQGHQPA